MSFPNPPRAAKRNFDPGPVAWFLIIVGMGLALAVAVIGVIILAITIGENWVTNV